MIIIALAIYLFLGWKALLIAVAMVVLALQFCKWLYIFLIRYNFILIDPIDEDDGGEDFEEYIRIKYGHKKNARTKKEILKVIIRWIIIMAILSLIVILFFNPFEEASFSNDSPIENNQPVRVGDRVSNEKDSFVVVYRQPINGYQVKAIAKLTKSDVDVISADLYFNKNGKSFVLHTQCFGDTLFSKGRLDYDYENTEIFNKYRNNKVEAVYQENKEEEGLPNYTPFFFKDMDFDGVSELVIVHYSMAVRYGSGYDVYRIVEDRPLRLNYPPYDENFEDWGFGMTDYLEFDFQKKTISCPYPEGSGGLPYEGRTIYGISKKQKDTIIVNGKKHYFNHLEVIEEIKYNHDE